jgi:hypothetical protein
MNVKVDTNFFCLVMLVGILSPARQAQATLGEGADSIVRDRKALSAKQLSTTCHASYTIQEIASEATTIREYLTLSGVVFAIAWNGLVNPDLTTLLGSYAGEFEEAKQQSPSSPGQRQLTVRSNRVVVETGGHMRDLRGRAYLPALLPGGVSVDEIN